jgi:crossover junction endodeoxyribonuclease RusA
MSRWKPRVGQIVLNLPWPDKALHSNARVHWAEKAKEAKKARKYAWAVARSVEMPCWPEASILIEYWPRTRRGDPQNVPSSLKAYIDGIADAMGCDDRRFKVDYPTMFAGTSKDGLVVFRVYER